jgi:hypothetical protein
MNPSTRINRHLLRLGATLLLAAGLSSAVFAAGAKPLPPDGGGSGILGVVNHVCPDAFDDKVPVGEPTDDLMEDASTLVAGAPQSHNFDGNTLTGVADKDWARFEVVRTGVYTLTTSNLSAQTDTAIELYDAAGGLVAANDNAAGLASRIVWTAPATASGWYYLSVFPTGSTPYANCAGTVVSYTLSLDSKGPAFLFLPLVTLNYP